MNRRIFLQGLAAAPVFCSTRATVNIQSEINYQLRPNSIAVVRRWSRGLEEDVQVLEVESPTSLAWIPGRPILVAVNSVGSYRGLPTGSIESFEIEGGTGRLCPLNRCGLSLSATYPRSCAASPDGRHLAVAGFGGGIYNLIAVDEEGRLGPVEQAIKEIGSGPDVLRQSTAHPHSVAFHPSGEYLFATDQGCDRVNVFRFKEGRLIRHQQVSAKPGCGPGEIALNPSGTAITVQHTLRSGLTKYDFNLQIGRLTEY